MRVIVVLDPVHGDQLRETAKRGPVWIAMSPANARVVRELWNTSAYDGASITGMSVASGVDPEDEFLSRLDEIDLHHGPYSSVSPFAELEVIGLDASEHIRDRLAEHGLLKVQPSINGFICRRS